MATVPSVRTETITVAAEAFDYAVPGAQNYTGFLIQFISVLATADAKVQISLNGLNFATLTNVVGGTLGELDSVNGKAYSFQLGAPPIGGMKIATGTTENNETGTIIVSMWNSPYDRTG